jgi:hypothetical protein
MSQLLGKHLADGAVTSTKVADGAIAAMSKIDSAIKNVANGLPVLDAQGKILASQLPNSVMEYKGMWDVTSGAPSATPNAGDVYRVNVAGTFETVGYEIGDYIIYSGTAWEKSDNSDNELRNDLASVANGLGASLIGVEAGTFSATNLQGVVVELNSDVLAEVTARAAAIAAEVTDRNAAIAVEATARANADLAEITARTAAISAVSTAAQGLVQDEASARIAADLAEVTARDAAIAVETTNRTNAILAEVTARDAAIAEALAQVAPSSELITLDAGMITAKAFDLTKAPVAGASVILFPLGGLPQSFGVLATSGDGDFTLGAGAANKTISWDGRGMDSLGLVAGDKIRVIYFGG